MNPSNLLRAMRAKMAEDKALASSPPYVAPGRDTRDVGLTADIASSPGPSFDPDKEERVKLALALFGQMNPFENMGQEMAHTKQQAKGK